MAVLIRTPFWLFMGTTPTPVGSTPFISSVVSKPFCKQAVWNADWITGHVSPTFRLMGSGPSVPWKSSFISRSVSAFRK